jgi:hypothetical protein
LSRLNIFKVYTIVTNVWVPYWKTSELLERNNATDIKISAYLDKKRGALFVVANLGNKPVDAVLTPNKRNLGLKNNAPLRWRNEIEGTELMRNGENVSVTVGPGLFKMISLQMAPK